MFQIAYRTTSHVEPLVYLAGADGLAQGSCAVLSAGALAACGATVKPDFIIVGPKGTDGRYPAIPVLPSTVFETTSTATVGQSLVGAAVTLSSDAAGVTATTNSGVFRVLKTDGAATKSTVQGIFA